jgi:Protein of unknown function (DUF3984)
MEIDTAPAQSHLGHRPSSSRRSFPNLQHLSLAPLSTRFPIDGDDFDQETPQYAPPSTYYSGKSAPTTPGILSRGASPTRQRRRKSRHYIHEGYLPSEGGSGVTKAKSASALSNEPKSQTGALSPMPQVAGRPLDKAKSAGPRTNDEWMHRAGLAIASETRSNKGQSWLASRESSTSLVVSPSGDDLYDAQHQQIFTLMSGEHVIDDDDNPMTPRFYTPHNLSRAASRAGSRAASRRTSRRGSRVGSKLELAGLTALDSRTPSQWQAEGYFYDVGTAAGAEPDFVDVEEDDETAGLDDEEIAKLSRQRGFGIGGVIDKLVGWSLFNVEEDGEESATEERGYEDAEAKAKRRTAELRRRKLEMEKAAASSAMATQAPVPETPPPPGQGEEGGWKDAAWLLSVASRVIL